MCELYSSPLEGYTAPYHHFEMFIQFGERNVSIFANKTPIEPTCFHAFFMILALKFARKSPIGSFDLIICAYFITSSKVYTVPTGMKTEIHSNFLVIFLPSIIIFRFDFFSVSFRSSFCIFSILCYITRK